MLPVPSGEDQGGEKGEENPREAQVAEAEKRPHRPQPLRHQVAHGAGEDGGLQA